MAAYTGPARDFLTALSEENPQSPLALPNALATSLRFYAGVGAVLFVKVAIVLYLRQLWLRRVMQKYIRKRTHPKVINRIQQRQYLADFFLYYEYLEHSGFPFLIRGPEQEMVRLEDGEIEVRLRVTPYLCSADSRGEYLSCATIMAIMDDVTNYCQTWSDKRLRWGPSLSLDAEVYAWVRPGETITVRAKSLKQGKSLAWLDVWIINEHGVQVAHGHHLKFVRNDRFDIWAYKTFAFWWINLAVAPVDLRVDPMRIPERSRLTHYFCLTPKWERGQGVMSVPYSPDILNWYHIVHGGALSMMAEQAGLKLTAWQGAPGRRVRSIHMTFLSPVAQSATIHAAPSAYDAGIVEFRNRNQVLTKCRMRYEYDHQPELGMSAKP